jgi:hypothetical protein
MKKYDDNGLLTSEEREHRVRLAAYDAGRPTLPRGVPQRQVDGATGDEYAVMPGFNNLVAVRRAGAWVGWVMVRHVPGLGQCSLRQGALPPAETIPGCDNENCRSCPRNVAEAREAGAVFVDGGWS